MAFTRLVNVENFDLIQKLIFVQIVAIELQVLSSHLSEIRKVITKRVWGCLFYRIFRSTRALK